MPVGPDDFRHEYDLDSLQRIRPQGHDFEMLVTPRFRRHFLDSRYETFMAALLGTMSRSHRLFLDVGAHYGFFSLLVATRNPEIEVVALEPVPATHEILVRNLRANGLTETTALRQAVSNRPGTAGFHLSLASDNCSFYPHPAAPPIGEIEVELVTIDQLLVGRDPCPLLVKVDTDGHEVAVLEGMAETLDRMPDVKLFVELNPKMQRLAGHEPEKLLAALDHRGFDIFLLDELQGRPYRIRRPADWKDLMAFPESYVNLYCCRKESSLSVCFASQSAALAGAERSLIELTAELIEDHGAMCSVLVPGEGPLVDRLRDIGAATLIVPYEWWCESSAGAGGSTEWENDLATRLGPSLLTLLGKPLRELRRIDPDVLVTHTIAIPWGALLAEILRKPHVWNLCEYGVNDDGFRFLLPADEVLGVIRSSSDHVFTANHGIRETLFPGSDRSFFSTLYRHVDVPTEAWSDPSSPVGPATDSVRIGSFGSLCPGKGQDLLVHAVARLVARGRRVELFLVGPHHGEFPARLQTQIQDYGLEGAVHLPGFFEDVYPWMRSMDIVVVGSRLEAFSRAAVEAMLLSRPVVYPLAGGPAEYMLDGITGLGYPPGDIDEMAEAIDRLVLDPALREQLGRQGRDHARETFTRDGYGGTAARVLRQLRGSHPSRGGSRRPTWWACLLPPVVEEAGRHERRELEEELARLEESHRREEEALSFRLQRTQGYLDSILGSATWKMLVWLRRPLDALAPKGTRLRKFLRGLVLNHER